MATISTLSWSDLPLDLLISVTQRLNVRSDLLSFRLVCSHWLSAVPCPKHLPWCMVTCSNIKNHHVSILKPQQTLFSIPLSFFSDKIWFLCASNGWLVFATDNNSYHLFDPVSHQSHWLPPLTSEKMIQKNRFNNYIGSTLKLDKAVVSMSRNGGVSVAGIALVFDKMGDYMGQIFCFFEIGKEQKWYLSKKRFDYNMSRIVGGGDAKRFYATDTKFGLYVMEAGPLMRWRRFNLSLPKRILDGYDNSETTEIRKKRPFVNCIGMRGTGDEYLELYGSCCTQRCSLAWLFIKVNKSQLRVNSKYGIAYGDGNWTDKISPTDIYSSAFEPRL